MSYRLVNAGVGNGISTFSGRAPSIFFNRNHHAARLGLPPIGFLSLGHRNETILGHGLPRLANPVTKHEWVRLYSGRLGAFPPAPKQQFFYPFFTFLSVSNAPNRQSSRAGMGKAGNG